ncbi:MAG: mono/diheme cytochrome c family protein [Arcticibacterium sp.]|jgi:mono/diheme cytochrome c family protein
MKFSLWLLALLWFSMSSSDDSSQPRSAAEELKTFQIAEGFNIELAAAEPLVEDPVFIKFDEQGRLWVIEMRGFMHDVHGTDEKNPIGRVAYLEDSNADGQFDKKTIFADSLVLPRSLQFYQDGVLISENVPLWFFQDIDNDGVTDKKILVDSLYGGSGLPEHSANGLLLGLDNWLYNAKSKYRYKRNGDEWIKEETEFRGQWGIAKDDFGKLYYNYNWSQLHADLVPPNYLSRNPNHESSTGIDFGLPVDRQIFPIRTNPAVNRGYIPGVLGENGKLSEFTSACAPFVSRDKRYYSEDFYGNVLVCEPAGNLVKRNIVYESGIYLNSDLAYEGKEFLASKDERFRPVSITSGPDGAIYLVDMYRGISQHAAYMTEYLRKQTIDRKLEKGIHYGRIWKITPEGFKASKAKDLSQLSSTELVANLAHPIAWYRDNSQRILLQQKRLNARIALENMVKTGETSARISALWLLEGLHILDSEICLKLLDDQDLKVKANALRLLEMHARFNLYLRPKIENGIKKSINSGDVIDLQILLSSIAFSKKFAIAAISKIIAEKGADPLLRDAAFSSLNDKEADLLIYISRDSNWAESFDYKQIFIEHLAGILIKRGKENEIVPFLSLIESLSGWQKEAMLMGASLQSLAKESKPIVLAKMPPILISEESSSVLANLKKGISWPGKIITINKEKDGIILDAAGVKQFVGGRQVFLSYCAGCHGTDGNGMKRFAPPLAGSEWVIGNPERLALILLHGMEGAIKVKNKMYDAPDILPIMPSHSTLSLTDMSNVLTYIRNEWGNSGEPISSRTIAMLRLTTQGKVVPWTPHELNALITEREKQK